MYILVQVVEHVEPYLCAENDFKVNKVGFKKTSKLEIIVEKIYKNVWQNCLNLIFQDDTTIEFN